MKTIILTFSILMTHWATAQDPLTYQAFGKSFTRAPADGDLRLVVLDQAQATLTIGTAGNAGQMTWQEPLPTGLEDPALLAAIPDSAEVLAGSEKSNRLTLFTPESGASSHIYPSGPAPAAAASFQLLPDNANEFLVAWHDGPDWTVEGLDQEGDRLGSNNTVPPVLGLWPIRLTPDSNVAPRVALMNPTAFIVGESIASGLANRRSFPVTASGMTYGFYDGSDQARVIAFQAGESSATTARISNDLQDWEAPATLNFPREVECVVTSGSGRLGVLYRDRSAEIYDLDGTMLRLRHSLPGSFDLLAPLGNDDFLTLSDGTWTRWQGAGGTMLGEGAFPRRRVVSNVLFVSGRPMLDPDARPLSAVRTGDWSITAQQSGPNWQVTSLRQVSGGLGNPTSESLTPPPGTGGALVNQFQPQISVSLLGGAAGPITPQVFIEPGSGTYGEPIEVTFSTTLANATIFYRFAAGDSWLEYDESSSLTVANSTSLEAYAEESGQCSPVRQVNYLIAASPPLAAGVTVDVDNNGLSDQWEDTFQIFDPLGDADGDGDNNLTEFQNGTDPRSGLIPLGEGLLQIQGTTDGLVLTWPHSTGASLESSDDLSTWSEVTTGIQNTPGGFRYAVSIGAKGFFRLKR